jgi:uncharacterized protein (DUF3084 family)
MKDVTTEENFNESNEFVKGLHHRSWIVQIRQLKSRRRNDLEKLLSIFDQDNRTSNHIMNVNEDDFPEEYAHIIRRLRKAGESEKIKKEMELEDDIIEELRKNERKIEEQGKVIEEQGKAIEEKDIVIEEKDKALEEQGKVIEEKDIVIEEKDKALEEKDKALEEKNKEIEEKNKEIEMLKRLYNKK